MAGSGGLQDRVAEREALLGRAIHLLSEDPRISAVWLHGSIGRGRHDEWSDLDLWIVVEDDEMENLRAERQGFAEELGDVLLTIEAPQNAPPGGAYLTVMYGGNTGPQILDCSWQPLSTARRPADTLLLFDRAGIPQFQPSAPASGYPEPDEARMERAGAKIRFAWMIANIVAKYIARDDTWGVLTLLSSVWSALIEIEWLVGRRTTAAGLRDRPGFAPPLSQEEELAALRSLIADMEVLMQGVPGLRAAVGPAIEEQTRMFLSTVTRQLGLPDGH